MFQLLEQVSDADRYLTLAEIRDHTDYLAGKKGFRVQTIGHSRLDQSIDVILFGNGDKPTLLMWGNEDPHEPICSLSIIWLCRQLADADSPIHQLDYNWAIIPCLNPDGVARNERWFLYPGDLRAFLKWSWEDELAFWDAPVFPEEFALEQAIVLTRPELLFAMHDESHFPGHGYWALTSDEAVLAGLGDHFSYENDIGVEPVPAPVLPETMRGNWYFRRAHGLSGRCLSMICEPRGYRQLAPPREPQEHIRQEYMAALTEYEIILLELSISSEEERALIQCATSCLDRMRMERLFAICVGACGLRVLGAHGKVDQADSIEKVFWKYLNSRLEGTYTTLPIRDQVRIQLHFLFSVLEQATGKQTFSSAKPVDPSEQM